MGWLRSALRDHRPRQWLLRRQVLSPQLRHRGIGAYELHQAARYAMARHAEEVEAIHLNTCPTELNFSDIVTKPLSGRLRDIPGVSGATELGDRRAVLVLDIGALMEELLRPQASLEPRTAG